MEEHRVSLLRVIHKMTGVVEVHFSPADVDEPIFLGLDLKNIRNIVKETMLWLLKIFVAWIKK